MTIYHSDNTQPTRKGGFLGDFTVKEIQKSMKALGDAMKSFSLIKKKNSMPNREFLADFIKLNKIKKTRVSLYLGMAENWLTTMVNEKRRGDLSDKTLQDIMRKLHIDWTSQEFIHVKATKSNTAYKTKPCNYSRVADKERLQKAMWSGELI